MDLFLSAYEAEQWKTTPSYLGLICPSSHTDGLLLTYDLCPAYICIFVCFHTVVLALSPTVTFF